MLGFSGNRQADGTAGQVLGYEAEEVLHRLGEIARSNTKLRGSDVVKALELIGKYHKLFSERVELNDSEEIVRRLQATRSRQEREALK